MSVVSVANSIQAYSTLHFTQRVYCGPATPAKPSGTGATAYPTSTSNSPVTPLSARTFGTWTFITSIVRLYAAYNIDNPVIYQLALWTYGVAFAHFVSEWVIFKTTSWGAPLAGPVIVSTSSLIWMFSQWGYYVK